MPKPANHSLRRRLLGRLLAWQIVTLALLALSSVLVLYYLDDRSERVLDDSVAGTIADAIRPAPQGLALIETEHLSGLLNGTPPLWFVVVDENGNRLVRGDVPMEMEAFAASLEDVTRLSIQTDRTDISSAQIETEGTAAGDVKILFGGGPPPDELLSLLTFAAEDVTPVVILIIVGIGAMTFFVVPRIVTQSFAGLETVVEQASAIDIKKRGARLTAGEVPEEVSVLVNAVNDALERLDHGYARQQRFLADAAHELKTPIAILQNRLELSGGTVRDDRILLDVYRIANLAEQLLDLQRIEQEQTPTDDVDLVALGNKVIIDLAPIALDAGYEPSFIAACDELIVRGDTGSIERAMINLVQNAIVHGGGKGLIELSVLASYAVVISDQGPGIPDHRRDWIFEPFHRIKPRDQGSGLGLSLVREIMRRHNGSVTVSEGAPSGAKFTLQFQKPRV
jgi:signal transduction histidine kinase